ncbi:MULTISPECIES: patatin-like phospholipase family protein [Hungatella]|uniref:Patatin-like phospholipase family protein n=1 Tax=Hungatella hathewayi TaxID=154046 RepID=A0AAW9WII7_9FIRM|nr:MULTISPECIES: patatin-like phospholipase family protein [Hungatella]MCQ4827970.1 patatin-like phospholipase family protein [Hungatella sp. SL.1.14]MUB64193.1 patatin-like phospholipase family protein [Hungatella hathewayi]CUP82069.1 patatin [Hungatella hathewayi]
MELKLDLTREYGIVLEGGGAKGAYQIGAWKALREAGIRIKGIAGASVGSLNGALICMDDLEKAEGIWKNIEYSRVMDVSDETIKALKRKDFKALNMQEILNSGVQFIKDGGFDVTPLKNLIAEVVGDESRIRESDRELFAVTYSVSEHRELAVDVRKGEEGSVKDMLLASAYFMAFKNEKLGGKRYRDGGGLNNVPLGVLLDKGYEDIIVIRIYGWGFDSEKVTKIPEGVNVYHIAPRQDLGGILEFDKKQSRKNMTLGYYDAKRFLYGLAGRIYYIDAPGSEPYYFDKMMSELELLKIYVEEDLDQETRESLNGYRMFTETLFPRMAEEFKLKEDWNYRDLYIAILEDLAKRLKINRFQIYTVDRLIGKIMMKLHSLDSRIPL